MNWSWFQCNKIIKVKWFYRNWSYIVKRSVLVVRLITNYRRGEYINTNSPRIHETKSWMKIGTEKELSCHSHYCMNENAWPDIKDHLKNLIPNIYTVLSVPVIWHPNPLEFYSISRMLKLSTWIMCLQCNRAVQTIVNQC